MIHNEHAIVLRQHGGPDQLQLEPITVGAPKVGEIKVRHRFISLNFHDIYVRTGEYRTLELPGIPGLDAAGVVEAVGPDVTTFKPGDRVAYIDVNYGAYSTARLISANKAFLLPSSVHDRVAASTLLRTATVAMLAEQVHSVKAGDYVLVQAAAGGVGQLLCGWLHNIGAHVIGTVSAQSKVDQAMSAGADEVIVRKTESVSERIMEITAGEGVTVAYDSCGIDTFQGTLDSLSFCGHIVIFGQSSGPIPPFPPGRLADRSLTMSRPILFHYLRDRASAEAIITSSLAAIGRGTLPLLKVAEFPLADAAGAQCMLAAGEGPGAIVLVP